VRQYTDSSFRALRRCVWYGIDEDRAFAVLKRYSQHTNTKLRDVAQQLIDTRHLPR